MFGCTLFDQETEKAGVVAGLQPALHALPRVSGSKDGALFCSDIKHDTTIFGMNDPARGACSDMSWSLSLILLAAPLSCWHTFVHPKS